jgi:hypothetical protein
VCRRLAIWSVDNWSGKMSVNERRRTDIDHEGTEQVVGNE